MTTLLIYASADLELDLCHTPFWRDDIERYVAERAEDARELARTTEPNLVVVERDLPAVGEFVASVRRQSLPHPVLIVALSHLPVEKTASEDGVDAVLSLPLGPEGDRRLDQLLQMPTRRERRFDVRFDAEVLVPPAAGSQRGLVLNISAGGLLVECSALGLQPGDELGLILPLPDQSVSVEGRARVVRTPAEGHFGLRFEGFAGDGEAHVRDFLTSLGAAPAPRQ